MKKIRIGLLIGSVIVIIVEFIIIDYTHLDSSRNIGSYLVIFSLICTIIGVVGSINYDKKQKAKDYLSKKSKAETDPH